MHLLFCAVLIYTAQILISITIKISIGLNALVLPLWHLITFDIFLQMQQNFQWSLKMQCATTFYANHPLDARWSENVKCELRVKLAP